MWERQGGGTRLVNMYSFYKCVGVGGGLSSQMPPRLDSEVWPCHSPGIWMLLVGCLSLSIAARIPEPTIRMETERVEDGLGKWILITPCRKSNSNRCPQRPVEVVL